MRGLARFAVLLVGLAANAGASTFLLSATAQGWMTATMNNGAYAGNDYLAGNCGAADCYSGEFRDFFDFNIPALDGPVLSATLLLNTAYTALLQGPSLTYQVTSVDPALGFAGLGTGSVYGSQVYSSASQYQTEGIPLDAAGLAAIQAAGGGVFVIGGRVTSSVTFGGAEPDELVFGHTSASQELEIVTGNAPQFGPLLLGGDDPPTPEPTPAVLIAAGMVLLVLGRLLR